MSGMSDVTGGSEFNVCHDLFWGFHEPQNTKTRRYMMIACAEFEPENTAYWDAEHRQTTNTRINVP